MRKFGYGILAVLLTLAIGFGVSMFAPTASAQDTNIGVLHNEKVQTFTGSINTTTSVFPATTGKILAVKSLVVMSSVGGAVVFQDGSGGTAIANIPLAANTPLVVDERALGVGFRSTSGNGIFAVLAGATLTVTARVQQF